MTKSDTDDFRGLLFNPTLENEVVMLFSMLIHARDKFPDSYIIDEGDSGTFPDCFALRNGEKVGIEFETYASHFKDHKHQDDSNLTKCNIILCWENDLPGTIKRDGKEFVTVKDHEIEIISLKDRSHEFIRHGQRPGVSRRDEEGFFEQLGKTKPKNEELVKELFAQVKKNEDFEIKWGGGKRWLTMKFILKKWNVTPMNVKGSGSVEIVYQDNKSILPCFELPKETKSELRRIFPNPKMSPWHNIPLENRTDLDNIYEALNILGDHSKRLSLMWHYTKDWRPRW